jgi:betaine lipid synthase
MFGEGKHPQFRELLVSKLSPHLSSRAFQYWLAHSHVFTSKKGYGLYETGGSRHSIKVVRWLFGCLGMSHHIRRLCAAKTLNEQREIWYSSVRKILLSKYLASFVVGNEKFLWKAFGVPRNQRDMILSDYAESYGVPLGTDNAKAIWEYVVNTLDPVVSQSLLRDDNYFYLLSLTGKYTQR